MSLTCVQIRRFHCRRFPLCRATPEILNISFHEPHPNQCFPIRYNICRDINGLLTRLEAFAEQPAGESLNESITSG